MTFDELLKLIRATSPPGLCVDSRLVKPGDVFVAVLGPNLDGHNFIPQAISNGAKSDDQGPKRWRVWVIAAVLLVALGLMFTLGWRNRAPVSSSTCPPGISSALPLLKSSSKMERGSSCRETSAASTLRLSRIPRL